MNIDDIEMNLDFTFKIPLIRRGTDNESDDVYNGIIRECHCNITGLMLDTNIPDDESEVVIGGVELFNINLAQAVYRMHDVMRACDNHSQEVLDYVTGIDDLIDGGWWSEHIIIIREMMINEKYRGIGIGHHILHTIMENVGTCGDLFLTRPFPLQHSLSDIAGKYDMGKLADASIATGKAKLEAFYKSFGFSKMPNNEVYYYINE